MSATQAEFHARLALTVQAAESSAMRADQQTVERAVQHLAETELLDKASAEFLRESSRMVVGLSAALNAVLDVHQAMLHPDGSDVGCRECGTAAASCRTLKQIAHTFTLHRLRRLPCVDAAEAWRRARARYRPSDSKEVASLVTEISGAFVVRSLAVTLPSPPARVGPGSERVLVVDKLTGQVVVWPLMPEAALAASYARYRKGQSTIPLETDGQYAVSPTDAASANRRFATMLPWWMRLDRLNWWRSRPERCTPVFQRLRRR
ncbi:hypothetical protein ACQEU3_45520 [Spirillospora sp. CA-253888]